MPKDAAAHAPASATLAEDLLRLTERARARANEDPFGNPVLAIALAITNLIDDGELTHPRTAALIRHLRDEAAAGRARRLATYVGLTPPSETEAELASPGRPPDPPGPGRQPRPLARLPPAAERPRFAAVFTAHPTFALPPEVFAALADRPAATPPRPASQPPPTRPTLAQEFDAAAAAITHGRDALDTLNRALLTAARATWPDRWSDLQPRPIMLASWVGYDTDGRTDIGWWDTLRLRLTMKRSSSRARRPSSRRSPPRPARPPA